MTDLPDYFFRIRDNGATVFRVDTENRQRRIDMQPLAVVNVRSGEIRPQGERALTPADTAAIEAWLAARREVLAQRETDAIQRTLESLNAAAHWAQTRASDAELDGVTDALLMAMHDLRSVLVRRQADRQG